MRKVYNYVKMIIIYLHSTNLDVYIILLPHTLCLCVCVPVCVRMLVHERRTHY